MTETIAEKVPFSTGQEAFGAEAAVGHEIRRRVLDLFNVPDSSQLRLTRWVNAIPEGADNEKIISGLNKERERRLGLPPIRFE